MASRAARELKKEWVEMSAECFEPLTFRDLKVGEKFIYLPSPGDNHGHGGLRSGSYVFQKIEPAKYRPSWATPQGLAIKCLNGSSSYIMDGVLVLRVIT